MVRVWIPKASNEACHGPGSLTLHGNRIWAVTSFGAVNPDSYDLETTCYCYTPMRKVFYSRHGYQFIFYLLSSMYLYLFYLFISIDDKTV